MRPAAQDEFLRELQKLIQTLESCHHPATDPQLRQAYKVKSYKGVVVLRSGNLIEYSLGNLARVIAKFPAREGSSDILLIAATLLHDHERLKRLIKGNRLEIDSWNGE
jgi:hypothetical protein